MIEKSLKKYRVWGKITAAVFVLMMLALIILAKGKETPDVCF